MTFSSASRCPVCNHTVHSHAIIDGIEDIISFTILKRTITYNGLRMIPLATGCECVIAQLSYTRCVCLYLSDPYSLPTGISRL